MAYIKLEIDVKNPDEIITNHKGQLIGLASLLVTRKRKKRAIQKDIYKQIIEKLGAELKNELKKEGVVADINLTIESDEDFKGDDTIENIL